MRQPIKAVLITMFQPPEGPGELSLLRERWGLHPVDADTAAAAGLPNALFEDGQGLLAVLAGVGTANAAVSLTSLGLCEQFDFTQTYWIVCGIAGMDPAATQFVFPDRRFSPPSSPPCI